MNDRERSMWIDNDEKIEKLLDCLKSAVVFMESCTCEHLQCAEAIQLIDRSRRTIERVEGVE